MTVRRRKLLQILSCAFGSNLVPLRDQFAIAEQNLTPPASPAPALAKPVQARLVIAEREKVTGIGGLFFRAHDPKTLALWYLQNLGISLTPSSSSDLVWQQEAGPTVFAPFPETTKYFGDPQKMWMVNFRVRDLDKMVAQLQTAGIEVKVYPQSDPTGRFAHLHDPEGNPIELWQPSESPASH